MLKSYLRAFAWFFLMFFALSSQAGSYDDFFKALTVDDAETVRRLLDKGFDPNTVTEDGQPALSYAMYKNAERSVRLLLSSPQLQTDQEDLRGDTPIMAASALNNASWAAILISQGARVNQPAKRWTALHYAAASGSLETVKLLLQAGADLDAKSANGTTPLMMAAREKQTEVALYLLEQGADPRPVNQSDYNAAGYAMRTNNKALALEIMRREKKLRGERESPRQSTTSTS